MSVRRSAAALVVLLMSAAAPAQAPLTPAARAAVAASVRAFAAEVATGVTRDGPTAWQRYFSGGPEFFMAVNGQLQFADGAAAARGIAALPALIQHLRLSWGEDLRVDPLTANLAMVAGSYREELHSPDGTQHQDRGFFSALAERREGRWRFRDAHWSSQAAAP